MKDWLKAAWQRVADIHQGKGASLGHVALVDLPRALDCVEAADRLVSALDWEAGVPSRQEVLDAIAAYKSARAGREQET